MPKVKKTFSQRAELRVNSVLVALDRLARVSNAENVVSKADQAKAATALKPALDKALAGMVTADRQSSGFKF